MSKFDEAMRSKTKAGEVLRFKDNGPSVEDAKKAMLAAGEAPKGMAGGNTPVVPTAAAPAATTAVPVIPEIDSTLDPAFEDEIPAVPAVPAAVTPPPASPARVTAPPVPAPTPRVERVENDKFIGEIKQEGGKWVAEIRYKTGAGTEKFTADSRGDLMLQLLAGKGHATLRVNKAVRREKFGFSELDKQYPLPEGISAKDFEEMSEKAQDALLWSIASQQTIMFRENNPEFYRTSENAKKLNTFLTNAKLPITARNLQYAYEELLDSNLPSDVRLEERPIVTPGPIITNLSPAPTPEPVRTDSAPAPAAPASVPTPAAAAVPSVTVRKRGTTGLQPGQSSSEAEPVRPEAGGEQRQPSEAELRKLSPIGQPVSPELRRLANAERIAMRNAR